MPEPELSDDERILLDSVLRMFPREGDLLKKIEKYIEYEQELCSKSSDGKWHLEFLAELEALRRKLAGQSRDDIDWGAVQDALDK